MLRSFRRYLVAEYGNSWSEHLGSYSRLVHQSKNGSNIEKIRSLRTMKSQGYTKHRELYKDVIAFRECITRASGASFWDWNAGSRLNFWRWPRGFMKEARDGTLIFVQDKLPLYTKRQRWSTDEAARAKLLKKLLNVRQRGYVAKGHVISLTGFFAVKKGQSDIRVVYDATKCGLNQAVWAPNFFLPTIDASLRCMDPTTICGDIDLGEMFLNYPLDATLQPYAGVDVTDIEGEHKTGYLATRQWERWVRCLMGFKPSPYITTRAYAWSEETIRGDPSDESSLFHWDDVVLNMPGTSSYDPSRPWMYKVNSKTGQIAGDAITFVDDIRPTAPTIEMCERLAHQIASRCNYLGQQDAARKRREPSATPGM